MINKKNNMIWLLIVFLIANAGCRKVPWRAERYIEEKTATIVWSQQFPDSTEYKDYFVNESFIEARVIAHNETIHSASAPYYLVINGIGLRNQHSSLTIHNLKLTSSLGRKHDIRFASSEIPIKIDFKKYDDNPKFSVVHFKSANDFQFNFSATEIIKLEVDVEVTTADGKGGRKIIKYQFVPKLEEGDYQMIHH